jgi:hypothetical protein
MQQFDKSFSHRHHLLAGQLPQVLYANPTSPVPGSAPAEQHNQQQTPCDSSSSSSSRCAEAVVMTAAMK